MVIYSVPSPNTHVQGKKNTLIMSLVLVNIQRKQRATLGLLLMWFIRHGRIVKSRLTGVSSHVRLGISES